MDEVSEIKSRLGIEDVVSEYVQLKRAGRNFKGLSPFTPEKTASFVVSPEKQIWHDFSSGKGGDVFSFVMEVEGMDFKAALELLARKAGVELAEFKPNSNAQHTKDHKNRLYEAVEHAVRFYQFQLTKNEMPLRYLREKRSYAKQTLLDFRFGYSPSSGNELLGYLTKKGFTTEELKKAGLVSSRDNRVFDMFRDRVMIPLSDAQGRPVGFTARQMTEAKNSPKYINTPATILYDKGRQVFGLSQAKDAIRKTGFVVVVEGNLDVVASHQAGINNVVASAGTALTTFHLKDLKRFTGDIRLAFDDDRAGQEAAARTIPLAQALGGIDLSIVSLPEGKDPDDLIRVKPDLWRAVVEKPKYMIDWLIERMAASVDLATAQGKRQLVNEVIAVVRQLNDAVEQEHYAQKLAELTSTSKQTITSKMNEKPTITKRLKPVKRNKDAEAKDLKDQRVREQHLLAICANITEQASVLRSIPIDVFSPDAKAVVESLIQEPPLSPKSSEYVTMLALLYEEYYQYTDEDELKSQVGGLVSRLVHTYAKIKKITLAQELSSASEEDQKNLLETVKQLDKLVVKFSS